MNSKTILAALLFASAGAASAEVKVNFLEPEKFMDMPFAPWEKDEVMAELGKHFQKLGASLPAGQNLTIEVTDIDLAGNIVPGGWRDIRVLRGKADWPRMSLRYSLEQGGKLIQAGQSELLDMNYLMGINHYWRTESMRYEKKMIDDWFKKEILKGQTQPRT